jgi:pimeloyl-ACP methyl ester carboxylesterase
MSAPGAATEVVFLPGFDGVAELRTEFTRAIGEHHPVRPIGYPNRKLETLDGYARHAAGHVAAGSRPVVVAESFSGLVAARWASQDPHIAGLVLCGSFARSTVPWAALGAALPATAQFVAAAIRGPIAALFAKTPPVDR